jgi:hypothetical protein
LLSVSYNIDNTPKWLFDFAGETLALIGLIWDSMLLDVHRATHHYRAAMEIAHEMQPRPVDKSWYRRLQKRIQELQQKVPPCFSLVPAAACYD